MFQEGRGKVTDSNVYVDDSGYAVKVKSGDEPTKARIIDGNFVVGKIQFENITDDIVYNQGANSNMLLRKTMLEQKALMIWLVGLR